MTRTTRARESWPELPWHDGIQWFTRQTVAPTETPVTAAFIYDSVIRGADLSAEREWVDSMLSAGVAAAEHATQRALSLQTWEMVLSGFPSSGRIVLERPPLVEVTGLAYYDTSGTIQQLAVSPAEFETLPNGRYTKAELRPELGGSWPSTYARADAVTVTYQAGYADADDPVLKQICAGIGLWVAELYSTRKLSVHAVHNTPSVLDLSHFWRQVR